MCWMIWYYVEGKQGRDPSHVLKLQDRSTIEGKPGAHAAIRDVTSEVANNHPQ